MTIRVLIADDQPLMRTGFRMKDRQKTRMNVEYPVPERFNKAWRQQAHVACETNEIDGMLA